MMKSIILIISLIFFSSSYSQKKTEKFKIGRKSNNFFDEFSIINSKGDTIKKLDKKIYNVCFTNEFENFAIFGIKGKQGWYAVDKNGKILFEVFNRYFGGNLSRLHRRG